MRKVNVERRENDAKMGEKRRGKRAAKEFDAFKAKLNEAAGKGY